ncbi:MAG: hypothetical protein FJW32_13195 [Acidobacteria bacterium]|nr:hypothetical protein [Acidobacteriota bacterium]
MNIDWSLLPVAFAGGALGAALGANVAFIFTGFLVMIGVAIAAGGGGRDFIGNVAFGPLFGPHISFAGGVAAAAFAAKRGKHETGRDIGKGLAGLNAPDVLLAGGAFGVVGFLIQSLLAAAPTDSIALTVFLSAVIVRLVFGSSGLFPKAHTGGGWLPYQRDWPQLIALGATLGLGSAWLLKMLGADRGGDVLGFGVAAASLTFLQSGTSVPVWHHIALPAAIASTTFGGNIYAGAAGGAAGAIVGEIYSRVFHANGDTHIDPPACAIFTLTAAFKLFQ